MKKPKPVSAAQSPAYRKFQSELYIALDELLNKAQAEINDQLRFGFTRALELIAVRSLSLERVEGMAKQQALKSIDDAVSQVFQFVAQRIFAISVNLGINSQVLSIVGSAEALGRALQTPTKYKIDLDQIKARAVKGYEGENLYGRIELSLNRIKRKLFDALEYSMLQNETPKEMIERLYLALPKQRRVKRPKKAVKQLKTREADAKPNVDFTFGIVDDAAWDKIVSDYLDEYIPEFRGPETELNLTIKKTTGPDVELRYGWEHEQYVVDDFVKKVREGEVESAKQNGITDFQWIAILDDKTCTACCAWRDGLTSREIEQKLKENRALKDACAAIVPPAHFNCRCDFAPMTVEMPDQPISNAKEFEEWLLT